MSYTYTKKSPFDFLETIDELRISFAEQGFGVVSNIDIGKRIRDKVDKNFGEYITLGFCHPDIAYKYLSEDMNLGVFMPCSVLVYEKDKDVYISAGLPDEIMKNYIENTDLKEMNIEVSDKMKVAINNII